jgi:hypothetical protein
MKDIVIRFFIVLLLSSFWIAYRIFYIKEDKSFWNYKECINDYILDDLISPLTIFISQHLNLRDFIVITCSIFTDIFLFYFIIAIYKSGKIVKPFAHIAIFYIVKLIIIDQIFRFKILNNFLFEVPCFSMIVYDNRRTPYTFYSEYSGLPVILATQFANLRYDRLSKICLIITFINSTVVLITRKNSFIDVFFGILAAHYFYLLIDKIKFLNFPLTSKNELSNEIGNKEINIEIKCNNIIVQPVQIL